MNTGKTLFAQLMDFLPWTTFSRIVGVTAATGGCGLSHAPNTTGRWLSRNWPTGKPARHRSLLTAQSHKLYHMGFRKPVRRSTLADANEARDWRIYAEFAQRLIVQARKLYAQEDLGLELTNTVYALDSTTIDLCLSVFPWALFRSTKSAVKMHTLLDLRGNIPSFIHISDGKLHDVHALDLLIPEPGAIFVMDRGYIDFARLHRAPGGRLLCHPRQVEPERAPRLLPRGGPRQRAGVRPDHRVGRLYTQKDYPDHLRRVRFKDPDGGRNLVFLSNHFDLPALTVCALYKSRWQVELFFKWIKQHLRIKQFYGTSENAVKTQIWIAVSVYVLVAIVKKRLNLDASLYTLLQILSVTLFDKIPLQQALTANNYKTEDTDSDNQLDLFTLLTGH